MSDEKTSKRKGWIIIELEKEGQQTISVECPVKIKSNFIQTFVTLRYGFPQFNVKPMPWKSFFGYILLFLCIFLIPNIGRAIDAIIDEVFYEETTIGSILGIIGGIAFIIVNFIATQNYYFNFIRKRLSEGYVINDSEAKQLCEAAGVYDNKPVSLGNSNKTVNRATVSVNTTVPPVIPQVKYNIAINGQNEGPYTLTQLGEMALSGKINGETLVWKAGMSEWTPAAKVVDFESVLSQVPPPIPSNNVKEK